jgi:hypothetical protein
MSIYGPKREEITERGRKLHNKELHDFCYSPSITRTMESRRMRWAGHVAQIGEMSTHGLFVEETHGKEDQDGGGWIILIFIMER